MVLYGECEAEREIYSMYDLNRNKKYVRTRCDDYNKLICRNEDG